MELLGISFGLESPEKNHWEIKGAVIWGSLGTSVYAVIGWTEMLRFLYPLCLQAPEYVCIPRTLGTPGVKTETLIEETPWVIKGHSQGLFHYFGLCWRGLATGSLPIILIQMLFMSFIRKTWQWAGLSRPVRLWQVWGCSLWPIKTQWHFLIFPCITTMGLVEV